MMKKILSFTLIAALLAVLAIDEASAQRYTRKKRYQSIGVSLNAMNYFGDVVPQSDFTSLRFKSTRPNIGINYTKRLFPRISVRGNFFWGRITGDDAKSADPTEADNRPRYLRNLSFRNDIKELSGQVVIDLFQNRGNYIRRPDFVPYAFVGVGVIHHNPKAYWGGGNGLDKGYYALQPLGTEGQNVSGQGYPTPYSRIQIVIPAGLGIRYKLDRHWDLAFEIGWRKTFTDYLDDVSGSYAAKSDLYAQGDETGLAAAILSDRSFQTGIDVRPDESGNPNIPGHNKGFGYKGAQRGDRSDKDWYIVSGFNLTYILNPNIRSPKFR